MSNLNNNINAIYLADLISFNIDHLFYYDYQKTMISSDEELRRTVNIVFDKYDQNKDGYLGLPEVESYLNDAMKMQEDRKATAQQQTQIAIRSYQKCSFSRYQKQHFTHRDLSFIQITFNISVILNMKAPAHKNCTLHNIIFQYFCEKCYEPICRQCTIIGPHNTQMHAISSIASAYERRVNQIRSRITSFVQEKNHLIEEIKYHSQDVEQLKQTQQLGLAQNERHRIRIINDLQRSYERIGSQITLTKQQFENRLNELNGLGHSFEIITDNIQIVASHSSIMHALKQCTDRIHLLLDQEKAFGELPKQLTSLRTDLKCIETYKDLIDQKKKIILEILDRLDGQKQKIEKPTIDYQKLLSQLSQNIQKCINHNVCHFCGVVFTIEKANTICKTNNSTLDINQFIGFCNKKPDTTKWSTHRHYFDSPANRYSHFTDTEQNTFTVHLKSLLLKLQTICLVKKLDLKKSFKKADWKESKVCDRISMMYILIEVCGLSEYQCQIILSICEQPSPNLFNYTKILQKLDEIRI